MFALRLLSIRDVALRIGQNLCSNAPWVRPWFEDVDGSAVNAGSRRPYRGINPVLLGLETTSRGYALNRWVTRIGRRPSLAPRCGRRARHDRRALAAA